MATGVATSGMDRAVASTRVTTGDSDTVVASRSLDMMGRIPGVTDAMMAHLVALTGVPGNPCTLAEPRRAETTGRMPGADAAITQLAALTDDPGDS